MLSNKPTTEELVTHIREWSINRVKYGITSNRDAVSIIAEFEEWIEPEGDRLEMLSIEERRLRRRWSDWRQSNEDHHHPSSTTSRSCLPASPSLYKCRI